MAAHLAKIRTTTKLIHSEYHPVPMHERLQTTHKEYYLMDMLKFTLEIVRKVGAISARVS